METLHFPSVSEGTGTIQTALMPTRTLTILGCTGSIGTNTLDVVRQNPDRFQVFALAAGRNIHLLAQQIGEFHPAVVVVQDPVDLDRLRSLLKASGVPVDISKRVANQAAFGDVLLTNAVMDLVSGSGVAFTDRGACNIDGVSENCRLFAPA